MQAEQKFKKRWLHAYTALAIIGVSAVVMPWMEVALAWGARKYATILALLVTPLLLFGGYGIQCLFLIGRKKGIDWDELNFLFESSKRKIPVLPRILAWFIAILTSVLLGKSVLALLRKMFGDNAALSERVNEEVGTPLLIIAFAVVTCIGCTLVAYRFHQLLSLRTMISFLVMQVLIFALKVYAVGNAGWLCLASMFLYLFILTVLMNQESVIQPSYVIKTCYATKLLRWQGIADVCRFWRSIIKMMATVTISYTLLSIGILRLLQIGKEVTFEQKFSLPFRRMPNLNLALLCISCICMLILAIKWLPRLLQMKYRPYDTLLKGWWDRLKLRIWQWLHQERTDANGQIYDEKTERCYLDTYEQLTPQEFCGYDMTWRNFQYRMRLLGNDKKEKYILAYRVLVARLCKKDIGIAVYHTPLEIAAIVEQRTTIVEMPVLTGIYMTVTYAETRIPEDEDIQKICALIEQIQ